MAFDNLRDNVERYYTQKFARHGATYAGVDWNSKESQALRFDQLLKICDGQIRFSINDLGCGYGALYDYLVQRGYDFQYHGYDLSRPMIEYAKTQHGSQNNCTFSANDLMTETDYTVASGIFNVKLDKSDHEWKAYILDTLTHMNRASRRGFAFNILTLYSDPERRQNTLYYADPCYYFDYCKRNFARNVALLHDYGLYEFTIVVRKE